MLRLRDWFGDGSVLVLDVPLACCAIETQAAAEGLPFVDHIPEDGTLVVTLSGTITHAVVPSIQLLLAGLPRTPVVLAFGACACVGGPYWDSYSVAKGADSVGIPVDRFIPGCPPTPDALHSVLQELRGD
ncbi:MAG: proton-conducting membrane transporter [Propionibacteriaceae bacterium]|nr:proton-conducting membrane transporter [Propionibacteriaceae bacterium]